MPRQPTVQQQAQVALIRGGFEPTPRAAGPQQRVTNFEHGWEGSILLCHRYVQTPAGTLRTDIYRIHPDGTVTCH